MLCFICVLDSKQFQKVLIRFWVSQDIMLVLSLLHMIATKAELFVPEEISDSALGTEDGLTAKSNDSDESADPFVSSSTDPEVENGENIESSNQLVGNENSSGLLDEGGKAQEEASLDNSPLAKEDDEKQETQSEQDSQLFGSKGTREDSGRSTATPVQTLKSGQVPKPGVPYWTEVYVDKKMKSVLVNVKTVTIIESINGAGRTKYPTTTASSRTVDPYIKIQMPSTTTAGSASKKSSSSTKTGRKSTSVSLTSREVNTSSSSIRSVSRHQSKPTTQFSTLKKQIKSVAYGPYKKLQSVTASLIGSSSAKPSSKSVSAQTLLSSARKTAKSLWMSTGTREKTSTSTKKEEAESGNSLGSIFNVLKDMPYGGKDSENLYIEGTFRFPKKKSLNSKSFKMSGYISTV